MTMPMHTKQDALAFLSIYANHLMDSWARSPEGVKLGNDFKKALEILQSDTVTIPKITSICTNTFYPTLDNTNLP